MCLLSLPGHFDARLVSSQHATTIQSEVAGSRQDVAMTTWATCADKSEMGTLDWNKSPVDCTDLRTVTNTKLVATATPKEPKLNQPVVADSSVFCRLVLPLRSNREFIHLFLCSNFQGLEIFTSKFDRVSLLVNTGTKQAHRCFLLVVAGEQAQGENALTSLLLLTFSCNRFYQYFVQYFSFILFIDRTSDSPVI